MVPSHNSKSTLLSLKIRLMLSALPGRPLQDRPSADWWSQDSARHELGAHKHKTWYVDHAVNQITLTESCPKNGDVSEVSAYKKKWQPDAVARREG
jgi:hypothetical protein